MTRRMALIAVSKAAIDGELAKAHLLVQYLMSKGWDEDDLEFLTPDGSGPHSTGECTKRGLIKAVDRITKKGGKKETLFYFSCPASSFETVSRNRLISLLKVISGRKNSSPMDLITAKEIIDGMNQTDGSQILQIDDLIQLLSTLIATSTYNSKIRVDEGIIKDVLSFISKNHLSEPPTKGELFELLDSLESDNEETYWDITGNNLIIGKYPVSGPELEMDLECIHSLLLDLKNDTGVGPIRVDYKALLDLLLTIVTPDMEEDFRSAFYMDSSADIKERLTLRELDGILKDLDKWPVDCVLAGPGTASVSLGLYKRERIIMSSNPVRYKTFKDDFHLARGMINSGTDDVLIGFFKEMTTLSEGGSAPAQVPLVWFSNKDRIKRAGLVQPRLEEFDPETPAEEQEGEDTAGENGDSEDNKTPEGNETTGENMKPVHVGDQPMDTGSIEENITAFGEDNIGHNVES